MSAETSPRKVLDSDIEELEIEIDGVAATFGGISAEPALDGLKVDKVRLLTRTALALADSDDAYFDDRRLAGRFVDILAQALGASKGGIFALDASGEIVTLSARQGSHSVGLTEFSRTSIRKAVETGEIQLLLAGRDVSGPTSLHLNMPGPSVLVPVLPTRASVETGGGKAFAVICLVREAGDPAFDPELPFLRLVARLVSPLLQRSRVYRRAVDECARVQDEFERTKIELGAAREKGAVLGRELEEARGNVEGDGVHRQIVGRQSAVIIRCIDSVQPAARSSAPVILRGETGAGKELFAHAIHSDTLSPRRGMGFVAMNCATLTDELLMADLFGHEKGAFTDAKESKPGLFRTADGGTLFLDEVTETSPRFQASLLRVLQEGMVRPVGSSREEPVDVRVIVATNRDLEAIVAAGTFRADLYHRLKVIEIRVPALRERVEDIPELAMHFLRKNGAKENRPDLSGFSSEAMRALRGHPWPGNVRSLENTVRRAVIFAKGPSITIDDLCAIDPCFAEVSDPRVNSISKAKLEVTRDLFLSALERSGGDARKASKLLGCSRAWVYELYKKYEVKPPSKR